jgi:hypothetical protein
VLEREPLAWPKYGGGGERHHRAVPRRELMPGFSVEQERDFAANPSAVTIAAD